jgi:hypothetical protein
MNVVFFLSVFGILIDMDNKHTGLGAALIIINTNTTTYT